MIDPNSSIDFALVAVFLFFGFFVGLIFYLRREDRREGYPLEEDPSGRLLAAGGIVFNDDPKVFHLPFGRGDVFAPNKKRDNREIAAKRSVAPGSPLIPTGNPMLSGLGPGSYAERAKVPDLTEHGNPKIVPMRVATDFIVIKGDADPRGMTVTGLDGAPAGIVEDIWVDRAEGSVRYLQVAVAATGASVLLPITMAVIQKGRRRVAVDAITAAQFADVPQLASPDSVTFDEEERVTAYYGAGYLYATPARSEPVL